MEKKRGKGEESNEKEWEKLERMGEKQGSWLKSFALVNRQWAQFAWRLDRMCDKFSVEMVSL